MESIEDFYNSNDVSLLFNNKTLYIDSYGYGEFIVDDVFDISSLGYDEFIPNSDLYPFLHSANGDEICFNITDGTMWLYIHDEGPDGKVIKIADDINDLSSLLKDNKIVKECAEVKKNFFFEMEVDDDMPSGDGSLDFDFDSDTSEDSSDNQSIDNTPKSAEEGSSTTADDSIRKFETRINHKLPKDFVEGVSVFNDPWIYCDTIIKKDGKTIFCVEEMYNIREIIQRFDYIEDPTLMALASDGYGNHIVMRITDNTYHVWYHDRWDGDKNLMIQIASAFNDTEGNSDNLIAVLDAGEKLDTSNTDDVTQEAFGPDDYRSYIDDYLKKAEPSAADDPVYQLELLIHDKLPKDFAEGVFIFDDKRFNNAEIRKNDEVIFIVASMWSIKEIVYNKKTDSYGIALFKVDDPIFAIGEDGYGNFIVMRTTDNTYHVLYHDKWNGDKNLMIQIATAFTGDEGNPDNLISILEAGMSPVSDDTPSEEQPTRTLFGESFHNISRFSNNIYQEADEPEEPTDEDFEVPKPEDSDDNEEVSDDESNEEKEVPEKETPDGEDLSSFGTDTSTEQNEYDPEEIKILNEMIGDEQFAMTRYFDAAKNTNVEVLRRLYSDIGAEESFHSEQLLYAKSTITGETYRPRNEDVKKEYEELLAMGMDEETAASTAIDKAGMIGGGVDDGDDSDMEEIEQESAYIAETLYHNEILSSICEHYITHPINRDKDLGVFVEAYFMEAIDNVGSAPKEVTKINSPISLLAKGLKTAINGLIRMSNVARDSIRRSKVKNHRKKQWIQKHGIGDLFKSGIQLYLYDDNESKMDFDTPARYVDFLYRLTKAVGESCGIKLTKEAQHKTISNPIPFKTVKEGMYKLSQVVFNKTKVVVTDNNRDALAREFFGYSDNKINVAVTHGTDQAVNDSDNIYNKLDALVLVTKKYAEISEAVLQELVKLEGDVNSIYYKNRSVYNSAKDNLSDIVKKYNQFISAMAHDLNTIIKLDNGLLQMTRERDIAEQHNGSWEGPDVRVNPKTNQDPKYTKRK